MGLPMYREPEVLESKATEKTRDPTAPARSSIRPRAAERAFHIETAANQAHADASPSAVVGHAEQRSILSECYASSYSFNELVPTSLALFAVDTSPSRNRLWQTDFAATKSDSAAGSAHSDASGTARFAPAHASTRFEPVLDEAGYQHHESNRDGVTTDDSMLDDLPPLRRVNRRYIPLRPVQLPSSSRGVVDGLGDRWRSVSPDNDPWETLLSTMPPDERLPSTSTSSFRSNEDPAPYDSLSRNTAETMRDDDIDTYPVICDNTDSDSIDDDDDDDDEDNAAVEVLGLLEEGDLVTFGRHAREVADSVRRSGPVQQSLVPWLTRRQQASPASRRNDSLNDRAQTRLDEMLTLNGRTNDGRPSRERL
ncbi:MAG: hypothetical protein L6R40_002667 [Gallowayella cf. fulva]|nr:MAG: hypothetical protein L6R40_002667 [Xanthomendoza cf. fulva]